MDQPTEKQIDDYLAAIAPQPQLTLYLLKYHGLKDWLIGSRYQIVKRSNKTESGWECVYGWTFGGTLEKALRRWSFINFKPTGNSTQADGGQFTYTPWNGRC